MLTLEQVILKGVLQRIEEVFHVKDPMFISSSDRLYIHNVIKQQTLDKTLQYPYCGLKISSVATKQTPGYNPRALLRHGRTYTEPNDAKTEVKKIEVVQVDFGCELSYVTNDVWDALKYINRWMFALHKSSLSLSINYYGMNYDIKVELDTSVGFPEKDASVEIANSYEVVGNLIVNGYVSDASDLDQMPPIDLLRNTRLQVFVGPSADDWSGAQPIYQYPNANNSLVAPLAEAFSYEVPERP